jgi:hypothetical protein
MVHSVNQPSFVTTTQAITIDTLHFLDDLGSATPNPNEDPQLVEEDMVNDNNASCQSLSFIVL